MRRRKIRKFADNQTDKQSDKEHFKHWGHSNPLWILGGAGQYKSILTKSPRKTIVTRPTKKPNTHYKLRNYITEQQTEKLTDKHT